jgi:hypothetical protein
MIVLRALIECQDASVEELAQRTGIADRPRLAVALDRLISLTYAVRLSDDAGGRYRPVVQRR